MALIENLSTLKRMKTLEEVIATDYYQEHFVDRYMNNLPLMAFELFDADLTWQQCDVVDSHSWQGGKTVVSSGHGTGKTFTIGLMATAAMLLFPLSIVRIQAPSIIQTKLSFKEIIANFAKLKAKRKFNGTYKESKWGFLTKFFQFNVSSIYVKGYRESWYIEQRTAPKGESTNLSGQHNRYYLLILEEMSGISDEHIVASLGGISETINSCIGFSQHTRNSGKFHDFMTNQNIEKDGAWNTHILNSEESPRVTDKALRDWKSTYNDNESRVRVQGLPPLSEEGMLMTNTEAYSLYSTEGKEWIDTLVFENTGISSDVCFTGMNDKGVIVTSRVANIVDDNGFNKLYIIIDKIQAPETKIKNSDKTRGLKPMELMKVVKKEAFNCGSKYPNSKLISIAVDKSTGGDEAYTKLEDDIMGSAVDGIDTYGITWGDGSKMSKRNKKRYINERALCYDMFRSAAQENRVFVNTDNLKGVVIREVSNLPYEMTENFRMKMFPKSGMKKLNISSPDVADCFAQLYLIPYEEQEADSEYISLEDNEIEDEEEELEFEDEFSVAALTSTLII